MFSPKINFLFCPYHNSGAHFLNWSIYYLSGKDYYLSIENYQPLLLPEAVNGRLKNFHQHQIQLLKGHTDVVDFLSRTHDNPYTNMINLYLAPIALPVIDQQTLLEKKSQGLLGEIMDRHNQAACQDMITCLDHIQKRNHPIVMIKYHDDDYLNRFYNDRHLCSMFSGECVDSVEDTYNEWEYWFFDTANDSFEDTIWDRREKLALRIRPWNGMNQFDHVLDTTRPHLMYDTNDLWNDLPRVITEILDFIGATLHQSRWHSWSTVYNHWRTRHDQWFSRDFRRIIDSVINNRYMSLKRYDMTFYKEVLIQHALIFDHDLNLKTWQLAKFPDNTQDLHALLEPNIHKL